MTYYLPVEVLRTRLKYSVLSMQYFLLPPSDLLLFFMAM